MHLIDHSIHKLLSTMTAIDAYDFLCDIGRDPWHATKNYSRGELLAFVYDYVSEWSDHFFILNEWLETAHT